MRVPCKAPPGTTLLKDSTSRSHKGVEGQKIKAISVLLLMTTILTTSREAMMTYRTSMRCLVKRRRTTTKTAMSG